ncbi:antitoxin VapB family protein [Candidatus Woesearchaeota archaeon]|nr:antitoxin VapB family protein [Candidatus Woesearchaeota archaeon]
MVIKSLTITEHAYEALKTLKMGHESFSDVILRLSTEKVGSAAKFFGAVSSFEGKKLQQQVKSRRMSLEKEFLQRAKKYKLS